MLRNIAACSYLRAHPRAATCVRRVRSRPRARGAPRAGLTAGLREALCRLLECSAPEWLRARAVARDSFARTRSRCGVPAYSAPRTPCSCCNLQRLVTATARFLTRSPSCRVRVSSGSRQRRARGPAHAYAKGETGTGIERREHPFHRHHSRCQLRLRHRMIRQLQGVREYESRILVLGVAEHRATNISAPAERDARKAHTTQRGPRMLVDAESRTPCHTRSVLDSLPRVRGENSWTRGDEPRLQACELRRRVFDHRRRDLVPACVVVSQRAVPPS